VASCAEEQETIQQPRRTDAENDLLLGAEQLNVYREIGLSPPFPFVWCPILPLYVEGLFFYFSTKISLGAIVSQQE
jgi:hypothetical protein